MVKNDSIRIARAFNVRNTCNTATIDSFGKDQCKKIYCYCGRIVDVDKQYALRRSALGKYVECPQCRNKRISGEIDEMDRHYEGLDEVEYLE